MSDARTWIARLGMAGLCFVGTGCGGGGVPDPGSDPTATVDAPPRQVSGVMPSTVSAAPAAPATPPAAPAAPQVAQAEPAPAVVATPAPAVIATPAPASSEPVAVAAASPTPGEGSGPAAEEKPQPAAKGDASATNELLNLSSSTTNAAPAAEAAKGDVPVASLPGGPGNVGGPGGSMPEGGSGFGPGSIPGSNRGGPGMPGGPGGSGGMPGMPDGSNNSNQPANYSTPMFGAVTFLNAVKSKNKDRIADATARHAQAEAHSAALQKLFAQILDLSVSDEQIDELAKALNGYVIQSLDMATSSGRQKVVLGKSNNANGQFRRTITMRHEAKGWKVLDLSGQSEIQGFQGVPMRRRTR